MAIMPSHLSYFTKTATILLILAIFSDQHPIRQVRYVKMDIPLQLRINEGLEILRDFILTLFPITMEQDIEVSITKAHTACA